MKSVRRSDPAPVLLACYPGARVPFTESHAATTPDGLTRRERYPLGIALALLFASIATLGLCACSGTVAGTVRENPKDHLPYVFAPSGSFEMGCSKVDRDCQADEKPAHTVTISKGFWIGQTEVPVEAYRRFTAATHRSFPPEPTFGGRNLNEQWATARMPITNVDWADADAYCKWIGGSLPTEAQWEYAARGGTSTSRYGDLSRIAWFGDNAGQQPIDTVAVFQADNAAYLGNLSANRNTFHQAGLLAPNSYRLYDMLGNTWEWTRDWYGPAYYHSAERFDPPGQPSGDAKVIRGGSWVDVASAIRVSLRGHRPPAERSVDAGFRCVQ